jgi:predicted carbohydrate-binding protein with CBM5 and CBM33 domain
MLHLITLPIEVLVSDKIFRWTNTVNHKTIKFFQQYIPKNVFLQNQ